MEKNYQQKLFWLRGSALERLLRKNLLRLVLLFLIMLQISQAELENLKENSKVEFLVPVGELEMAMELEMVMELVMAEDLEKEGEDQLEE